MQETSVSIRDRFHCVWSETGQRSAETLSTSLLKSDEPGAGTAGLSLNKSVFSQTKLLS